MGRKMTVRLTVPGITIERVRLEAIRTVQQNQGAHAHSEYAEVGHSHSLDDLDDVDAAAPGNGHALVYNDGTGLWEPQSVGGGGGGGGGSSHPYDRDVPYFLGMLVAAATTVTVSTTGAPTGGSNRWYCTPFMVNEDVAIEELTHGITSGSSASHNQRLAIYEALTSPNSIYPGDLVHDFGDMPMGTGEHEWLGGGAPVSLTAGTFYWLVWSNGNGGTSTSVRAIPSAEAPAYLGRNPSNITQSLSSMIVLATGFAPTDPFPSTFPGGNSYSTGNALAFWAKFAAV